MIREFHGIAGNRRNIERATDRLRLAVTAVIHESKTESRFIECRQHGLENAPIAEPAMQYQRTLWTMAVNEVTYHRASLLPLSLAALTSIRRPELNSVAFPGRHNHTI